MVLPAGIDNIRAFAFDVDGTLTRSDSRVSQRTFDALRAASEAGLEVIIVTGRIAAAARDVLKDAGIHGHAISCNGALVESVEPDEVLLQEFMEPEDVDRLLAFAESHDVLLIPFSTTRMFALQEDPAVTYINDTGSHTEIVYGPFAETLDKTRIMKSMVHASRSYLDEIAHELREVLPTSVRSLPEFFEMSHADTNKWTGLKLVLERLGIDPSEVAGAGDGENDLCWLRQIGFTAAPSNALPLLHDLVDSHLGDHDDDAVAEWIEEILAARG